MYVWKPAKFLWRLLNAYLGRFNVVLRHVRDARTVDFFVASLGHLAMRKIDRGANGPTIASNTITGYGVHGLAFGGPTPHFFYEAWHAVYGPTAAAWKLGAERALFTPLYQYVSVYALSRLEEKPHRDSLLEADAVYWEILAANLLLATVAQCVDMNFMPPAGRLRAAYRVGVDFFWAMHVARVRIDAQRRLA